MFDEEDGTRPRTSVGRLDLHGHVGRRRGRRTRTTTPRSVRRGGRSASRRTTTAPSTGREQLLDPLVRRRPGRQDQGEGRRRDVHSSPSAGERARSSTTTMQPVFRERTQTRRKQPRPICQTWKSWMAAHRRQYRRLPQPGRLRQGGSAERQGLTPRRRAPATIRNDRPRAPGWQRGQLRRRQPGCLPEHSQMQTTMTAMVATPKWSEDTLTVAFTDGTFGCTAMARRDRSSATWDAQGEIGQKRGEAQDHVARDPNDKLTTRPTAERLVATSATVEE